MHDRLSALRALLIAHGSWFSARNHQPRAFFAFRRVYASLITHHSLRITAFAALCSPLYALCVLSAHASGAEIRIERGTTREKVTIRKALRPGHDASEKKTKETFLVEMIRDMQGLGKGLSQRQSMQEDHGMLFVLDGSQEHAFWMKGMMFPLDIIFTDGNMQIIEILENLQPCEQCPLYFPEGLPAFALEINAGLSKKLGISVGDTLVIEK